MDPASQALIEQYTGMAHALAVQIWEKAPHALDLDDMKSVAVYGLVQATVRWPTYCTQKGFDPAAMQYFRAYISRRIRGAVYDEIRSQDWATRALRTKARRLLLAGQDEGATETEMAERAGMTVREVRTVIAEMARKPVYLADDDEPGSVRPAEVEAQGAAVLREFVNVFTSLTWDQQVVVALRHFEGVDLKEAATRMNLSDAEVNDLHDSAVLKVLSTLRNYLR